MKIAIAGIFGRIGKLLTHEIENDSKLQLVGGTFGLNKAPENMPDHYPVSSDIKDIINDADVLIDFSINTQVSQNIKICQEHGKPYIGGVTNLSDQTYHDLKKASFKIPVFYDTNMSQGLTVLKFLGGQAAQLLNNPDIEIFEMHQKHKKDAPSGTALAIAKYIDQVRGQATTATVENLDKNIQFLNAIGLSFARGGNHPGRHDVMFCLQDEIITLSHQTYDRKVYAQGAIKAAQWIINKHAGFYDMFTLLGLNQY